jgi:hypothetical protein
MAEEFLPGVWVVTTASHGGIMLSAPRQAAMPEALRLGTASYEEDCDWALPVLAFRGEFEVARPDRASWLQLAVDTVRCWHPDRYEAFTGEAVLENASRVLRQRAAYLAAIGKHCVTAARGDWADWVLEGKTGVVACKVLSVDHLGNASYSEERRYALVDKHAYAERGEAFCLEDHTHELIEMPEEFRPTKRIT